MAALVSRAFISMNMMEMQTTTERLRPLEQAREYISRVTDSYNRCGHVIETLGSTEFYDLTWDDDGRLEYSDWLELLGENWTSFDNLREHLPVLKKLLSTYVPLPPMMTPEENAAYDALPRVVTVYRGCDSSVLTGAAWSLDREVANSFPFT